MKALFHTPAIAMVMAIHSCAPVPFVATRSPEVRGTVLDAKSRQALPNATIQVEGTDHPSTRAKADGSFVLPRTLTGGVWITGPCPKGPEYTSYSRIIVSHGGYASKVIDTLDLKARNPDKDQFDAGPIGLQPSSGPQVPTPAQRQDY